MGTLKTKSTTEYYREYYQHNKTRYKNYYREKLEKDQERELVFGEYGGERAYYRLQYVKFIQQAKEIKEKEKEERKNTIGN
tara:strand:+ start:441 stop:683 length:243 start_codon:yes stop_codon:yes gene_type:complete